MKNPRLTILFFFVFIIWQLFAGTETPQAETAPVNDIKTDADTSNKYSTIFFDNPDFNFGTIHKGQKIEHVFTFENRGNDTLEIKKVKTSCGCTAAILTNNTISPGKTGEIKATFSSGSFSGNIRKSITVSSNDPNTPDCLLTISGEIIEDVSIKPEAINFGSLYADEKEEKTVTISITSQTDTGFKINKITPSKPFIKATIAKENDGEYIIEVTLKHKPEIGRFSGGIYLETDNKMQEKINIPFFGEIIGDITPYPKKIYYGLVAKGKASSQKLYVKINKDTIEILDIKTFPDYVSARIIEKRETNNPHYLIEVTLHSEAATGKIDGILEIHTNSKSQPVTRIPIVGEIGQS